jgi:beta-lactamase regulating signal transducer with metallopeptidase domain
MNVPLWFSNLVFWSAQVALLAIAAAILIRLLRIRHPETLLVHWRALLVTSLLLPALQPWHRQNLFAGISLAPNIILSPAVPAPSPATPHWPLLAWTTAAEVFGVVLVLGIALRLAIFILGLVKLRQLRLSSSASSAGAGADMLERACALVGARAEFRVSVRVRSPVTFGFAAPLILLPERFQQLDAQSQTAVACHELLHVRRHDWAHHLIEEILRIVFWFHPSILWLVGRVRLAREQVVDLEVLKLTQTRKAYLEALLEFAPSRARAAAISAPPFLAERQLVERVSLMLKEVRMSRARLIASWSVIVCFLLLCAVLAVTIFPLKAAPRPAANSSPSALATEPIVEANSIWTDTVKRGDMTIKVRGLAKLLASGNQVRVSLPEMMMVDVRVGQNALVDTHSGVVKGHVGSVSPHVEAGVRTADIVLDSTLRKGIASGATLDAMIQIDKLQNVVYVGRPKLDPSQGIVPVFKIVEDGNAAQRVSVRFGRVSVTTIQVLSGLKPGDTIILSNMAPYEKFARIQIKH